MTLSGGQIALGSVPLDSLTGGVILVPRPALWEPEGGERWTHEDRSRWRHWLCSPSPRAPRFYFLA